MTPMPPRGRRTLALALLLALGAWEPFRSPNVEIERGNEAYAKGDHDAALSHYPEAGKAPHTHQPGPPSH